MTDQDGRIRPTARVVLLDDDDRLLLLRIHDPAAARGLNPITADFWLLVGGGVRPGETHEEAALREVLEETGIREVTLGPWVWTMEKTVTWPDGAPMHVVARYYVGRVRAGRPISFSRHEPLEASTVIGYRWFTLAEIVEREGSETFQPPGLGRLLGDLLRRVPTGPLSLTW